MNLSDQIAEIVREVKAGGGRDRHSVLVVAMARQIDAQEKLNTALSELCVELLDQFALLAAVVPDQKQREDMQKQIKKGRDVVTKLKGGL